MFGLFRKKKTEQEADEHVDMNIVRVFYDGEVLCGDYDVNNPDDYPFHNLFPHGKGKITYIEDETIVESYEGDFKGGQYHGKGVLVDRYGEVHEGVFHKNAYVIDHRSQLTE